MVLDPSNKRTAPKDLKLPDPGQFAANLIRIATRSHHLVQQFLKHQGRQDRMGGLDPLQIGSAFLEMTTKIMTRPNLAVEALLDLGKHYLQLWHATTQRFLGQEVQAAAMPELSDRRFLDAAWEENQIFDFIKQSYLLSARWLQQMVSRVGGMSEKNRRKVDFYTRQFVDAMAPTNFVMTNPEVLRATLESSGENLVKGLGHLLHDLERGKGKLAVRMTDMNVFKLGQNIAVSPGKVIFQTALAQLIQYAPTTAEVYRRPLLIVPPWINKFYILDLRAENSFIKWAVDKGYTVFVLSWVNPDADLAHKTFEDYMVEGPLAALEAIKRATGEREVTAIGYCLGGTLLAATLAYMAAKDDDRIKTATFLASQVDFSEAGEITVFIDEEQLKFIEEMMHKRGYLDGGEMATTFNMLRANDLIWSFVVNNYLLGKEPFPFDLLFWNSDSTRMPAAMHSFYLRKMYQENLLVVPGGIRIGGVPIDLKKIELPTYIQAGKEDHIAPWHSVFKLTQHFSGPNRFMLAGSGHIAGVINPPAARKYHYWVNGEAKAETPEQWLAGASEHPGSWWPDWHKWQSAKSGALVPARQPGGGKLRPIEDAPGSYVRMRLDQPPPGKGPGRKGGKASVKAARAAYSAPSRR
jgi:polyhydroxyalkanoate synthase